ncbi:MAG: hypothetical protein PHP17_05405 [Candidatus Omnitrophica bacterium]|nr:hypothetical protein [Candidatus Omnitrophota bacterium]
MHDSSTSFLDPIAKVWNHTSVLGVSVSRKKKMLLKAKKLKKLSLMGKKQHILSPK